ncbi:MULTISPECIES: ACT domain-containing protein [Pseudomonadaceae]|jgi:glycine cleavage system transcriptional repressor|uniref:Glycine cleavage system protein R n=2 Tax=Pseudomonas abyssi TaxID=170540 RepID=A0ACD6B2F9_9PSED|nr:MULTISPECIES: ACT domain-containing protein [Pseudomonadaceae]MAC99503.1 glycine cleavage system protein R [Pseudomonadales bacterium]MAG65120.1 glycine cleavage system protein R [Pseudomonadales bacterium]PBK02702.1 glycine cleavage system protein R [Pseudomonas abyssi]RGP52473.1 glycine cleavage system protein R [Halopseudomonas gallaeciensis]|tara:strand:+ start:4011 stop:4568 length:558 start_codon:yes stop_codon:yes gene_type:complete
MSTPPGQREQYLVINVMGQETTSLASLLTRLCTEHRCQIVSSRMSRHGSCAVLLLQVSGNWDALARLETLLPPLAKREHILLSMSRSHSLDERPQALPYNVFVTAAQRAELVGELCNFFQQLSIDIEELQSFTYQAQHTGTPMLNLTLTIAIPAQTQLSWLREQFLDFCDELNLDAVIEPWRPLH